MAVTYKTFAKETLTVGTSVTSLTPSVYSPTGAASADRAEIQVFGAPIRYWNTGDEPTSTNGKYAAPLTFLVIDGLDDIGNFKAIRDNNAAANATIVVEYSRT